MNGEAERNRAAGRPNIGEREFETGSDEAFKAYTTRVVRQYLDEFLSDRGRGRDFLSVLNNITAQHMQNAVETHNMVAKRALGHHEIAVDREWNVDEVAQLVAKTPVFLDAISATVAATVTQLKREGKV